MELLVFLVSQVSRRLLPPSGFPAGAVDRPCLTSRTTARHVNQYFHPRQLAGARAIPAAYCHLFPILALSARARLELKNFKDLAVASNNIHLTRQATSSYVFAHVKISAARPRARRTGRIAQTATALGTDWRCSVPLAPANTIRCYWSP